jgi:HYDIN/CFA65/VesB family protein
MKRLASLLLLAGSALLGQQSAYNVSPTSLAFGNQTLNTTSSPRQFVVSTPSPPPSPNVGQSFPNIDFTISSTNPVFAASPTTFSIPANSGQSRTVNVTFTPTVLGTVTAIIRVTARVGESSSTTDVQVSGTGIARFTTEPTALNFGEVLLGCSSSHNIQVSTNTALAFEVASTNPLFTASPTTFSTQSSQAVVATFTPVARTPTSSSYTITASRGRVVAQTSTIQAVGSGVELGLSPTSLDFGAVPVGVSSAPRPVAFTLNPNIPVTLTATPSTSDNAFQIGVSGNTPSITFTPPTEGPFAGTITFTVVRNDRGYSPCTVTRTLAVRGSGTNLNLTANPRSLDFGGVTLGTTSAPRTTTVTNSTIFNCTGTASVGNPAFTLTPTTFSLAASRSQEFSLTFRPPAEGPVSTALNVVLTCSGGGTAGTFPINVAVGLSAEGINPAAVTVAPTTLDFGDVSVGSSAIRSLTVSNNGGVSSAVNASTSNPAFSVSPGSFTLAAGASQMVNLTFTPTTTGAIQSTATFAITGSSRAVALTGRGVAPNFTYQQVPPGQSPSPIDPGGAISFATTTVGATSDFVQFEIRNTGTGSAPVNAITPPAGAFVLDGLPPLPAVVNPGGSISFRIAFRPTSPGPSTGSLTIDGRAFSLSGNGVLSGATFTGAGATVAPATQPAIGLTLPDSYTVPVTGTATLTFAANAAGAANDPAIQFASGGRTVDFTVPAGSNTALFGTAPQIAFQSGTVAGTITIRATLTAGGIDVTPTPAPTRTFTIPRSGPVIRSVTIANRTATSFQAVIVAYAVTREVNTLNFTFTASGTGTLQTTTLPIDVATRFGDWYRSADAAPHGGAFTITVPFTVQGDLAAVRSLAVTLTNGDGTSPAMSVNF